MHLPLCTGHRVTLSHFHFETSVLFSKVIWNTVSLFITTISITTTLCIKTTININTNIIIAIITTSIYFITAISFVLTINTIYIIITTIITATLSFIIIIIISSKLRNSAFCYYHCEYNDISLQAPLVILLHSHHKSQ